jgi:hypothetical protein
MRQYVADASLAHCMHRDTIRQAITFVGACFVKEKTHHECFMALWRYFDIRTRENSLSLSDSLLGEPFRRTPKRNSRVPRSTSSVVIS